MAKMSDKMNIPQMEEQVKLNSYLLEEEIAFIVEANKASGKTDKYIVFHEGKYYTSPSLDDGLTLGIKKFGETTGFVLSKLATNVPVLSSLVKL